jgi:hypothetical protein
MSQTVVPPPVTQTPRVPHHRPQPKPHLPKWAKRLIIFLCACAAIAVVLFYSARAYRAIQKDKISLVPTAKVQRGDLDLTITAQGELRGQNPKPRQM